MKRIPLTFKTNSALKYELVKQRAEQLDRSVSDYVQLILKVHFGLASEDLLVPPRGVPDGLTLEQKRIVKGATQILREREAEQSAEAKTATQATQAEKAFVAKGAGGKPSDRPRDTQKKEPQDPPQSPRK